MKDLIRYPAVLATTIVAAIFSLIVALLLIFSFVARGDKELFDAPNYLALKEQLNDNPQDESVQSAIRHLDLKMRDEYFRRRAFMRRGVLMLLGGMVLAIGAGRWAVSLRRALPIPRPVDPDFDFESRDQMYGRLAALAVVGAILAVLTVLALRSDSALPASVAELAAEIARQNAVVDKDSVELPETKPKPQPTDASLPSDEEYSTQWPRFRGHLGDGHSQSSEIPDKWDVSTGEGILWKVPVPLAGFNSPVVWKDHVFLSGATAEIQSVFCFDSNTGEMRWRRDMAPPDPGDEEFDVDPSTGYAAPTMATDGVRAYAIFATGDLIAVDFAGNEAWQKRLGLPKNSWGHASSLATYKNLLIVQIDQGTKSDDLSKLIAIEGATGDIVWEVVRAVPASWASPIVVPLAAASRSIVVTSAKPWITAYAPEDGKELWRSNCLGGEVGPSPVAFGEMLYASNETGGMFAIRMDGQGDVTDTHIDWSTTINVPDVCSPLITDQFVFLLAHGLLACFDRKGGEDPEPLWEEDLFEDVSSSPSLAGNRIYIFSDAGPAWILEPHEDRCERIAELEMGEPCRSSPALLPGRIFIRGDEHLFCIGSKEPGGNRP